MADILDERNLVWVVPLVIWELGWKGVALWKAARNNHRNWFIAILAANTVGILPMVYLKFFQRRSD